MLCTEPEKAEQIVMVVCPQCGVNPRSNCRTAAGELLVGGEFHDARAEVAKKKPHAEVSVPMSARWHA